MEKVVCKVHRFAYIQERGCPFCEQERLERMYKRYAPKKEEKEVSNVITDEAILKLKEHFNVIKN